MHEFDDQISFLVDQAKKLSKKTYVNVTLKSMDVAPDFATMSRETRRYYRHVHKLVDTILPIVAGSTTPDSQFKLLKTRWVEIHNGMKMPTDYSWKNLSSAIQVLPDPTPYGLLNPIQMIHTQHATKFRSLDALLRKLTGGNDVKDHIILIADRLKQMHKKKPKDQQFLSLGALRLFEEHLIPLATFSARKPEFEDEYDAINILAQKLAGSTDPETVCRFLRTQFPQLNLTWNAIFDQSAVLEPRPEEEDFPEKMKSLLNKFAGDHIVEFLTSNLEVFAATLSSPVLQDLMSINNHIAELRRQRESNVHLKNFRRCILSCLTRSFKFTDLINAGWDLTFHMWKTIGRNRDDEKSFYDIDPASKAGNKPISEALANEIGQL